MIGTNPAPTHELTPGGVAVPQERQTQVLRFGVFEVNPPARELRKHGTRMRLPGQPFAILAMLLEKPGKVVTREEMRARLWASDTFVDFEHSLNSAIKKLRAALSDSSENSRYIETVPRVGYRFIAPVAEIAAIEKSTPDDLKVANGSGTSILAEPSLRQRWRVLAGISAALVVLTVVSFAWWRSRAQPQPNGGRMMLAVLPFENLTGDAGQEYFSDGLTEEMIAQLGYVNPQHLGVIARTSVMHYKHGQEKLDQIGQELGVQYVLEGSVRRDAGKVRITAQLIQMKDQTHIWSQQYDRELSNLLALQSEIAGQIADEIHLTLGDPKSIAPARAASLSPQAYEAYDSYLKGLYFWNKRTVQGFQQAIEYFQKAIAKDPNYARAYAGLADSYALIGGYSSSPQVEFMGKARETASRALEIDESLPEAHTARALIVQNYDWDWQTSEKEYRRAIELNPNYATAHHWYAEHLADLGRFEEAFVESERARQLDPLSLIIAADKGVLLYYSRQYDRAIEQFSAVLEMDPNFPRANMVYFAYVEKGMFAEAEAVLEKTSGVSADAAWNWSALAYVHGRAGQRERARHALEKLQQVRRRQQIDPAAFVWAYIGMGNRDEVFTYLGKAYLEHSNVLTTLKVEPGFDPLRSDPRFQDLLRRVGLADNNTTGKSTSKPQGRIH